MSERSLRPVSETSPLIQEEKTPWWSFFDNTSNQKMGVGKASFNIITIVMGVGVLNLPSGVSASGWFGVIVIAMMGLACAYTSAIIAHCMYAPSPIPKTYNKVEKEDEDEANFESLSPFSPLRMKGEPRHSSYTEIAEAAFGIPARIFVAFQVHLTLIGVSTIFLILAASFLNDMIEIIQLLQGIEVPVAYFTTTEATLIVAAVLWFHVWFDNLTQLGNLSFLSVLATILLVVAVIVDVFVNVDPDNRGDHVFVTKDLGFWTSFVAFAFSFGAHPVLPDIVREMKEPSKYAPMSYVTFFIITLSYIPVAVIGYWAFGDNTKSPILDNLRQDSTLVLIAIICLFFHLLVSYAVCLRPSEHDFEEVLNPYLKLNQPGFIARIKRVISRTLFLGITLGIALAIPQFGLVLDLVAALTNTFTVFVLPCAFFSKLFWKRLHPFFHGINFLLILVGFVACGIGTYNAVYAIIEEFTSEP